MTDTDTDVAWMVHDMIEDVIEDVGFDAFHRVEEIEWRSYDGYIPFTDGGWQGVATFPFHCETSWATDKIREYVDRDQSEMLEAFREEHGLGEDVEVSEHPAFEEWVTNWEQADETVWFVYARAILNRAGGTHSGRNETGEDEYQFCLGVNNDFNYGRDYVSYGGGVCTHWVYERTVPVAEITDELLAEIQAAMLEGWSNA